MVLFYLSERRKSNVLLKEVSICEKDSRERFMLKKVFAQRTKLKLTSKENVV
jgi:hypothetical protein